jgi:hypothetical protein
VICVTKKIVEDVNVLWEAIKEPLRVVVLGALSTVITSVLDLLIGEVAKMTLSSTEYTIVWSVLLLALRGLDQYWHEQKKENLLTKTLSFKWIG